MKGKQKLGIVVLFVLQGFWAGASHSAASGGKISDEEISKQKAIYESRGDNTPKGYVTDRSLLSYTYILAPDFKQSLADLGPRDRWLDIGAGEGRAILDYCTSKYDGTLLRGTERHAKKAQAVAMSIEDRRTVQWHQTAASLEANQIKYLFGRTLREYSAEELGKFQVITDVLGGFSYAQSLSVFMEKTLALLGLNGSFYTVLQDVRTETGTNKPHYPGARFLTEIADGDGSEVRMCWYLKRIGCVEVTCEARPEWIPPLEVYHVRKVCDNVAVPGLAPVHFEAGTPPERGYRIVAPTRETAKQ